MTVITKVDPDFKTMIERAFTDQFGHGYIWSSNMHNNTVTFYYEGIWWSVTEEYHGIEDGQEPYIDLHPCCELFYGDVDDDMNENQEWALFNEPLHIVAETWHDVVQNIKLAIDRWILQAEMYDRMAPEGVAPKSLYLATIIRDMDSHFEGQRTIPVNHGVIGKL